MAHFQMNRRQRIESRALVPSLASDSPQFWFQSRRRTHLSRLSTAGHHGPRRQQTRQATQIDGEHSQREYVAHRGAAAQLDLANRTAVLLAVAKQRFDHLANDLTHRVAGMPRGAAINAASAACTLARLGVVLVGVLRHVRRELHARQPVTNSLMSKFLSAPTVLGLVPGRSRSICSAASISAFPLACVSRVSTASLLRFSINTCPRYAGSDSCLFDLANSLASGSVVLTCVSLLRF